jgi:hypothetical protein
VHLLLSPPSFRLSVFTLVLGFSALACNEAPLIPAHDAGTPCAKPQPIYPCAAQEDAGVPGCPATIAAAAATFGQSVTLSAGTYPNNCSVEINSGTADQDNQCSQLGTCICGDDAGAFSWSCYE